MINHTCWVYFLKTKGEALDTFKKIKARIENEEGNQIDVWQPILEEGISQEMTLWKYPSVWMLLDYYQWNFDEYFLTLKP